VAWDLQGFDTPPRIRPSLARDRTSESSNDIDYLKGKGRGRVHLELKASYFAEKELQSTIQYNIQDGNKGESDGIDERYVPIAALRPPL